MGGGGGGLGGAAPRTKPREVLNAPRFDDSVEARLPQEEAELPDDTNDGDEN